MGLTESDRTEIQDLYGRYGLLIDAGDADGWANCFSEDGRMTVTGAPIDLAGLEQLAEFVRNHHASEHGASRHHITSTSFSASGGGAVGRAYALVTHGGQVAAAMTYDDELVKDGGAWRFSKRVITPQ
jgi:ketosteroid isomerase-like protein